MKEEFLQKFISSKSKKKKETIYHFLNDDKSAKCQSLKLRRKFLQENQ